MPCPDSIQACLLISWLCTVTDILKEDGLKKAKMTCTTVLQTYHHMTKLEIWICRSPSFPGWGNRAQYEETRNGAKGKALPQESYVNGQQDLSTGEWTSRRFSHLPYFIRRGATHEVPCTTWRYAYISLLRSVTDGSLEEDDCQHVGRGTAKRKSIKTICNYLAYTTISKVVLITILLYTIEETWNHRTV